MPIKARSWRARWALASRKNVPFSHPNYKITSQSLKIRPCTASSFSGTGQHQRTLHVDIEEHETGDSLPIMKAAADTDQFEHLLKEFQTTESQPKVELGEFAKLLDVFSGVPQREKGSRK